MDSTKFMDYEDVVTYETGMKLKKLGFDWPTLYCYADGRIFGGTVEKGEGYDFPIKVKHLLGSSNAVFKDNHERCDAPTLAQAAKWLRNEKNVHVDVDFQYIGKLTITIKSEKLNIFKIMPEVFDTHEKALEAGISEALNVLLTRV